MTIPNQRTLAEPFGLTGTGVHSGQPASLTFRPAEPNTGIRFRRIDLEGSPVIPADLEHVVRHGIHHPRTQRGFRRLESAFVTAEARRSDLRRARRLRDEFERVEHLMRKLDRRLADRRDHERPRRHAFVHPQERDYGVSIRFFY